MSTSKMIVLFFLFSLNIGQAQERCDCNTILDSVSEDIEVNSASYAHQVIEYKREKEYITHKKQIKAISKRITSQKECMGLIQLYLSFLRDQHQKLFLTDEYYPFTTFKDSLSVKSFIAKNVENFSLDSDNGPDELIGNWIHEGGKLEIQIQKNKEKGRTHIGVFKKPYSYYGKSGDLKIEFYKNESDELLANYWDFAQSPSIYKVTTDKNRLSLGRNLHFYRSFDTIKKDEEPLKNETYFDVLSEKTNYLRVHSFDYSNKITIDSIIASNLPKIKESPNLIIDVRDNGGGSDLSYKELLPLVLDSIYYKNPISASIWVSKDNLKNFEKEKYQYGVKTKTDSINADKRIEELKPYLGGFTPGEFWVFQTDKLYNEVKNVYLLINRNCASSTEGFILTAMQSSKVKTFGEHTSGTLSYGDWRELKIDGLPAMISLTTKKMTLIDKSDIESIGIAPDVELDENSTSKWLDIALKTIDN